MPHFIRTIWMGRPHFSIDHGFDPKRRREHLGLISEAEAIRISDMEAEDGIDTLTARYFPENVEPEDTFYGS